MHLYAPPTLSLSLSLRHTRACIPTCTHARATIPKLCLIVACEQAERHTKNTHTLFHFRAQPERKKISTVFLHSPKHVRTFHSLWANQLFWPSISLSILWKHVSICSGSFCCEESQVVVYSIIVPHFLYIRIALPRNSITNSVETCLADRTFFFLHWIQEKIVIIMLECQSTSYA